MIIFLLWVVWTSFIFKILGAELENDYDAGGSFGHGADYQNLIWWFAYTIQNFRNAIGDFQMPFYKFWAASANLNIESGPLFMIYIIYIFWILTTIGLQITMLNFLIAFISESYEIVLDTKL